MKLTSDDNTILILRPVGYEFPHLPSAPHDSNWLHIDLTLRHGSDTWRYTDPALLTYELRETASWFIAVVRGQSPQRLWFTEPELSFELVSSSLCPRAVRIYLSYGFRPPWAPVDPDVDFFLTFPVKRLPLLLAATSLRFSLLRFPQRTAV